MSSSQAELIRRAFREFVRRQSGMEPTSALLETTLIRNGAYVGRRFSTLGYSLVWFVDEQQIKLYGQDGKLLRSVSALEFCAMSHAGSAFDGVSRRAA